MQHTRSASAVIALLVVLLLLVPTTAAAQTKAAARSVLTTATAKWGAVAAPLGAAGVAGTVLTVDTTVFVGMSEYFDVVNMGTLPLSGQTFQIRSAAGFAGPRNPSLTLVACPSGAWKSGKCAAGEVSLGTTTTGNFTSSVPLEPGGRYSVHVTSPWYWGSFSSKISVSVSRDHVRAATVTNS